MAAQGKTWHHYLPLLLIGSLLYVVISTYSVLSHIVISFLLILLVSLALNPVVVKLRNWLGGRTVATALVVFIFLGLLAGTGYAFYRPVRTSMETFLDRLPEYWERIQRPLLRMEQKAAETQEKIKREVSTESGEAPPPEAPPAPPEASQGGSPPMVSNGLPQWAARVTSGFLRVASNAASVALIAATVFVGVVFTLLNPRPVFGTLYELVPERHHAAALRIARRIVEFVPRWAVATLMGMTAIGLLVFFAMWPIFGFQDALVLGLIALILEVVPYVGPILSVIPAVLLALPEGGWTPLWVIASYAGVQFLENNLVYPLIVGGRLSLHPVAVIFSILLCVVAFGVLGVILAVPLAAITRIFWDELYRPKFLPSVSDQQIDQLARKTLE